MSIGAIKEDSETLRRVGEFIRQGDMDKAYDLMAQSFGPASVEALKKAVSYGISPEKLGQILTKAPLAIDRFERRLQQRGKDKAMAEAIQKQAAAQKAAELKAKQEILETQRRVEERLNRIDKKRERLFGEHRKLDEKERSLREKIRREKKLEKRRQIEEELKRVKERKIVLEKERQRLEELRREEINKQQTGNTAAPAANTRSATPQREVSPALMQQSRGGR